VLADASNSPSASDAGAASDGRAASGGRGERSGGETLRVVSFERETGSAAGGRGASRGRRGGTIGEGWTLQLSDGSSSFFVPEECLGEARLDPGQVRPGVDLDPVTADALRSCSRTLAARQKAVELLARRAHSVQELRLKLLQRSFEPGPVETALSWLGERGYLDDAAFARAWVQRRAERHPEGPLALTAGLRRRGISRDTAEDAVAELCGGQGERALAEAALAGLLRRRGPDTGDNAIRKALQRRGFRSSLIVELLRERRRRGSG
jgi:regulatory protein